MANSSLEQDRDSPEDGETSLSSGRKRGNQLRTGLIFMSASLVGYRVLLFVIKIVLANSLSVADYGLVTYAWSTGTSLGFLLMIGREQDAIVMIPRMSPRDVFYESNYIVKIFLLVGVLFIGGVLVISFLFSMNTRIWGVIVFALANLVFQVVYYTIIATKSFKSHLILTTTFNGGALALIIGLDFLGSLTPDSAILAILLFMLVASMMGTLSIRLDSRRNLTNATEVESERTYQSWAFSRFERTNLRYFVVDICAILVPLLPIVLLESFLGLEEVGYYGFNMTLYRASIVLAVVVNITYGPDLSRYYESDTRSYSRCARESISLTIFLQGLAVIGMGILALPVVSFFGLGRYDSSAIVLQLLLLGGVFEALSFANASILRTSGNSEALLLVNLVSLGCAAILIPLFIIWFGPNGAALSLALVLIIQGSGGLAAIKMRLSTLPENTTADWFLARVGILALVPIVMISIALLFGLSNMVSYLALSVVVFVILGHYIGVSKFSVIRDFIRKSIWGRKASSK